MKKDEKELNVTTEKTNEISKLFYQNLTKLVLGETINNATSVNLRDVFAEILITLSPKERDVLRLRCGMDDGRERHYKEIAQLFGVTEENIRITEAKALRKLRHPNRANHLRKFLGMEIIKPLSES